ncbi:MAG: Diadenosine tetraphosphate (Ap4A) hydrolase related family hydrolase, Hit-like protein involved [Candidatus Kaiserbacteria bacterium]|nr:Diadenosine tetraphosphate (Ap4A) hydrolase related family hydrolase, Hit-like protein involved [Candidatus Kaiserbacteria bacterium]
MNNCIFCKIIDGDIPAEKIYEDDHVLAFLDIHPVNPGHTLIIPKNKNSQNIFDIELPDWEHMSRATHMLAGAITKALNADGINLRMNNREHAGQVVYHPHIHLIPRFKGDGLIDWKGNSYKEGEAQEVLSKIKNELKYV